MVAGAGALRAVALAAAAPFVGTLSVWPTRMVELTLILLRAAMARAVVRCRFAMPMRVSPAATR